MVPFAGLTVIFFHGVPVLAAFAWLRCDREDVEDCASFLRGHKILTRSGSQFGADPRYVRVSMLDRDDAYDIFVKRLASLK
jgi:L-tryptophan--pyruvate aminotransferase